jgi:small subunit ribosomal protein S2
LAEQTKTQVSIKDLLEAGAHFGHQTRRWNPKMKRFIFEARNGMYIIDLAKTMHQLRVANDLIEDILTKHGNILFVGTKKQAKTVVVEAAGVCSEHYVSERWLGGMLTNLKTIRQSVKKLEQIEKELESGGEGLTKKEIIVRTKLKEKLERNLNGVRSMRKEPSLLIVVDSHTENLAVAEARKLGIPVIAIADTNCDPDTVTLCVPANDDSIKSNRIILRSFADLIMKKKKELNIKTDAGKKKDKQNNDVAEELEAVEVVTGKES